MKDVIKYVVSVTVQLKELNGIHYMHGCYVDECYRNDNSPKLEDVPLDIIEFREESLIMGLLNCMYLAEKAGYRKTHESLIMYLDKMKNNFSLSGMEIEKKDVKDIQG